jgi:nicotinamidase-related amidase
LSARWGDQNAGTVAFQYAPGDALVVVDVINDFEHDDGEKLLESFRQRREGMTSALAAARESRVPVVYVNDARGRWDGDAPGLVRDALASERTGHVVGPIAPNPGEAVLLKHRYSGFDHTPLDLLLGELHAKRVVLMGAATEGCVVQTAIDAREHGLQATIVADACATTDEALEELALRYAAEVGGVRVVR